MLPQRDLAPSIVILGPTVNQRKWGGGRSEQRQRSASPFAHAYSHLHTPYICLLTRHSNRRMILSPT